MQMPFLGIVQTLAFGCRGNSVLKNCRWLRTAFPRMAQGCSPVHTRRTRALLRTLSTQPRTQALPKHNDHASHNFTVIYTFPGIKLLRAISRVKLLQTGITLILLPPVHYLYFQGQVTYTLMCYSTGIAVFAAIMLYSISHYITRFVGMMYLDNSKTTLKVSHLTFWGYRRDIYLPVTDVMTLGDTGDSRNEPLLCLKRYSCPDTLYFSTRLGRVVNKQAFELVFGTFP